jgi:hypothetical protein
MMNIESFVLFAVLLFLALLALAIRWLNEKIRRDIALKDLKDLFLSSDEPREQPGRGVPETTRLAQKPKPPILTSRAADPPKDRRTWSRLRLRNRADLRQGIVIMTVLGPCRALETQGEDHSSLRS